MAITYSIQINDVIPARNRYFKKIETSNYVGGADECAQLGIELNPMNGDRISKFKIQMSDGFLITIFVGGIDDSSCDYFIYQTVNASNLDETYEGLLAIPELNDRFVINYYPNANHLITLTEKVPVDNSVFDFVELPGSPIDGISLSVISIGHKYSSYSKYQFQIDLYSLKSASPLLIFSGNYTPTKPSTGTSPSTISINIGELVSRIVKAHIPSLEAITGEVPNNLWSEFFIRATEVYGDGLKETYFSNNFYAFYAGISNKNNNTSQQTFLGSTYHLDYCRTMRLYSSLVKPTRRYQPEYLYFWMKDLLIHSTDTFLVEYTFYDATGSVYAVVTENISFDYTDPLTLTYCLHTGTRNNSIIADALYTYNFSSYKVTMTDLSTNYFVDQFYQLDDTYLPNTKIFEYINQLGAIVSFYSKGEESYGLEISADSISIELADEFTTDVFETREYNSLISEEFEVNTGFIEKKIEAESMLQFFASEHKFIYDPNTNARVAILVDTKSIGCWKTNDGKYSFQFKYRLAQRSTVINNTSIFE